MESDDNVRWHWQPGERGFYLHIPPDERLPTMPSGNTQGHHVPWESEIRNAWVPDLTGCTLEEVQQEAARISMGDEFTSIQEFDRCLHSWCVLNGRNATKIKTCRKYALRVCQFGGRTRPLWRHNRNWQQQATHDAPPSLRTDPAMRQEDHVFSQGDGHSQELTPTPAPSQVHVSSNNPPSSQDYTPPGHRPQPSTFGGPGNHSGHVLDSTRDENTNPNIPAQSAFSQLSSQARPTSGRPGGGSASGACGRSAQRPCSAVPRHQTPCRRPLSQVELNAQVFDGHNITSQTSFIRNTRDWIPSSSAPTAGDGSSRARSSTGACGELARMPGADGGLQDLCPWRVRLQLDSTSRLKITVCNLRHTCPANGHKWRGPTHRAQWLGETLASRVVRNVKVAVKELTEGLQMDFRRTTTYKPMWRARDLVKDWYLGGQRESFHMIPALMSRLKDVDREVVVDWSTHEGTQVFKRAFICPSATRNFLRYCQPLVSLDACHTKNRKYPCQLFLATVLDGNMRGTILCYAIAPVESFDNWRWFLSLLDQSIEGIGDPAIPLISDRQKGLIAAVAEVLAQQVHGHCAHHLRGNVKKRHGRAAEAYFWAAVYAHTPGQFNFILESLQNSTASGREAAKYIRSIDPKSFARHAFPLPRLGKVTSNPVEQANSGLLPIREFAPFQLLVELWYYMQTRMNERRQEADLREEFLTSPAERSHAANLTTFGQWNIHDDGGPRAILQTADHRNAYIVDVSEKARCTCYELQEMIWPCEHVMAWDDTDGKDFRRHFHPCWLTSSLRSMYEGSMPVFLSTDLERSPECYPPEPAVKRGRHRVVRMRAGERSGRNQPLAEDKFLDDDGMINFQYPVADDPQMAEPPPNVQTLGRASERRPGVQQVRSTQRRRPQAGGRRVRCSSCGEVGHNRRTCGSRARQGAVEEDVVDIEHANGEEWSFQQSGAGSAQPEPPSSNAGVPNYSESEPDSGPEGDLPTPPSTMQPETTEPDPLAFMTQEEIDGYIRLVQDQVANSAERL